MSSVLMNNSSEDLFVLHNDASRKVQQIGFQYIRKALSVLESEYPVGEPFDAVRAMEIVKKSRICQKRKSLKESRQLFPFVSSLVSNMCCQGLAYNKGLFTQCPKLKHESGLFCKGCKREIEKSGRLVCGTVSERMNNEFEYVDGKGRKQVPFMKVAERVCSAEELEKIRERGVELGVNMLHFQSVEKKSAGPGRGRRPKKSAESSAAAVVPPSLQNPSDIAEESSAVAEEATVDDVFGDEEDDEEEEEEEDEDEEVARALEEEKKRVAAVEELKRVAAAALEEKKREEDKKSSKVEKKSQSRFMIEKVYYFVRETEDGKPVLADKSEKVVFKQLEIGGKLYWRRRADDNLYDVDSRKLVGVYDKKNHAIN